jgi:hypothetical protein
MNEPFTFRPSDAEDPRRGDKFEAILNKRGANPTFVLRRLIDAYIESDGRVAFPAELVESDPRLRVAEHPPEERKGRAGRAASAIIGAAFGAVFT